MFVETGVYRGVPLTAAELAKEYEADPAATVKKYDGKAVVLTGEGVSKDYNSAGAAGMEMKTGGKAK